MNIILVLIVIFIFVTLIILFAKKPSEEKLAYVRKEFLSKAERSFYGVLKQAVVEETEIFSKVTLSEFIKPNSTDKKERQILQNKIDRKHNDFLLCDPRTLEIQAVIELDDKSHKTSERTKQSDDFKNTVLKSIGIPLIRISAKQGYSVEELRTRLGSYLSNSNELIESQNKVEVAFMPIVQSSDNQEEIKVCPQCGKEMILREAKRGGRKGQKFWGCSGYPDCKAIIQPAITS